MTRIIICGQQGSGKSTLSLIDEWNGTDEIPQNSIVLTNAEPPFPVCYDFLIDLMKPNARAKRHGQENLR